MSKRQSRISLPSNLVLYWDENALGPRQGKWVLVKENVAGKPLEGTTIVAYLSPGDLYALRIQLTEEGF